MPSPSLLRSKIVPAIALTLMLALASGCQEQAASVADPASGLTDAGRAYDHVKKLVEMGPRPSGSESIKRVQGYVEGEIRSYGLKIIDDSFVAKTPRGQVPMRNIIGELAGEKPGIVIISGHYDTKLLPGFVGANDGGSSTAALLEAARVLSKTKPEYTLWFVFFDGEEAVVDWNAMGGTDNTYGSRHLVAKLKDDGTLKKVRAMILFDMIGDRKLDIKREGGSSAWLTSVLWDTARQMGHGRYFLSDEQWVSDDHVPFIEAGVPAVDLIDFNYGPGNAYWHTNEDTLDKVSGESIKIVSDVVIRALPDIFKQLNTRQGA